MPWAAAILRAPAMSWAAASPPGAALPQGSAIRLVVAIPSIPAAWGFRRLSLGTGDPWGAGDPLYAGGSMSVGGGDVIGCVVSMGIGDVIGGGDMKGDWPLRSRGLRRFHKLRRPPAGCGESPARVCRALLVSCALASSRFPAAARHVQGRPRALKRTGRAPSKTSAFLTGTASAGHKTHGVVRSHPASGRQSAMRACVWCLLARSYSFQNSVFRNYDFC